MLKLVRYSTRLYQSRQYCVKSREELEAYLSEKIEQGLNYLEKRQEESNSEDAQEDLLQSIARTNYLSKYFIYNTLDTLAKRNSSFKNDENFKVRTQ